MATLIYRSGRASDMLMTSYAGQLLKHDENSATVTPIAVGDLVRYTGHNFAYDGDTIVSGIATSYSYFVGGWPGYHLYARITDFTWDMANGSPDWRDLLAGNDTIHGLGDVEFLDGGAGDDFITAKVGSDFIGGTGDDLMRASHEKDHFVFDVGDGSDKILNFDSTHRKHDTIEIWRTPEAENVDVEQRYGRVVIHYGVDDKIVLYGVHLDEFLANDLHLFRL